jgi:NADH-quinone oxidoreductase subunit M
MKSLVAYSIAIWAPSLASSNFEATEGAVYQMLNHGLSTGALFLCVGILYERTHTRLIADYGGAAARMPVFAGLFLVAMLSSAGLPGLNGFVGEILCFFGVFAANKVLAVLGVSTVILSAAYLLWLYRRVMHGPLKEPEDRRLRELDRRELLTLVPIIVLIVFMGLFREPSREDGCDHRPLYRILQEQALSRRPWTFPAERPGSRGRRGSER